MSPSVDELSVIRLLLEFSAGGLLLGVPFRLERDPATGPRREDDLPLLCEDSSE